jgi:antitoxin (DNA-binding transcriptional repressor) of toxin-antitoxin stability system
VFKFKATCQAALERGRRTGRPLRVTRFGHPQADIVPAQASESDRAWPGVMQGRGRVTADLVAPAAAADEWDALR